jgi:two-component system NtrC family response regulator
MLRLRVSYNLGVNKPRMLLVDDDRNFLRVLSYQVAELGFQVTTAASAREALEQIGDGRTDLIISDLKMPGMDGLQLLQEVRLRGLEIPVILVTAHGSIDKAVDAIKAGAFDFLQKPFEKEELRVSILNALRMADLVRENRVLSEAVRRQFSFEGVVSSSSSFKDVLAQAAQLTEVDTTVLIQGESGTGKEVLARAIHFNGSRRSKPFITVNCGAVPENLVEAELFGYRKGSFTGAVSDRKGKFELASSGTIFLDEVGELPLPAQVKLLRVLQQREIDVIGDPVPHWVDVRVIAATNRDLQAMLRDGEFREDLYYRLSVAPLITPPLRSRPDDIPLLVHHFSNRLNEKLKKDVRFTPEAIDAMRRYRWPGNVRELENVVERLTVFSTTGVIAVVDLPSDIREYTQRIGRLKLDLPEEGLSLEELERDLLLAALEKHGWNQSRAARYLGITRNTLIYRMQKYELRPDVEDIPDQPGDPMETRRP